MGRRRSVGLAFGAAWCTTGAAAPLGAEPAAPHAPGLYARMQLGPVHVSAPADVSDLGFSASGVSLGGAIGGAVAENLILFGDLHLVIAPLSSSRSETHMARDGRSGALEYAWLAGVGAGAAYYVMPANLLLAASGFYSLDMKWDGEDVFGFDCCHSLTDQGLGASFLLGKEWWVADRMGLGVAATFLTTGLDLRSYSRYAPARYRVRALGIVGTATFN